MNFAQQCRCSYLELGLATCGRTDWLVHSCTNHVRGGRYTRDVWLGGRWEFFEGREGVIFLESSFGYSTSPVFFFLFLV